MNFKKQINQAIASLDFSWQNFFQTIATNSHWTDLLAKLELEYSNYEVYPSINNLFNCFKFCSFNDLKVVILGQDPYHTPGLANGLAFDVNLECKKPPSLKNILKKINQEYDQALTEQDIQKFSLINWAKQGVLLINASLTVRKNQPNSHAKIGWNWFLNQVINYVNVHKPNQVVYLGWGSFAQNILKNHNINKQNQIYCSHPSPFSFHISFQTTPIFSLTNEILKQLNLEPINWIQKN